MASKTALKIFRRRINIERKVLKAVNITLTACRPLAGLTDQSINSWAIDLKKYYDFPQVKQIVEVLTEISKRSMLNTDCSRDVFSNDELEKIASLKILFKQLEDTVAQVSYE